MTTIQKLTGLGMAPALARIVGGPVTNNLTATGTNQATALPIYGETNALATVAAGTGCLLPNNRDTSDIVEVINAGANALSVYPPVGNTIAGGAANAAFSVPVNKTCRFRLYNTGAWSVMLSA